MLPKEGRATIEMIMPLRHSQQLFTAVYMVVGLFVDINCQTITTTGKMNANKEIVLAA